MAECPFCGAEIREEVSLYGGTCASCLIEIPGEEAPTDPGEDAPTEEMGPKGQNGQDGETRSSSGDLVTPSASNAAGLSPGLMYGLGGFLLTGIVIGAVVLFSDDGVNEPPQTLPTESPVVVNDVAENAVNPQLNEPIEAEAGAEPEIMTEAVEEVIVEEETTEAVIVQPVAVPVSATRNENVEEENAAEEDDVYSTTDGDQHGSYNSRGMDMDFLGGTSYSESDVRSRASTIYNELIRNLPLCFNGSSVSREEIVGEYVEYSFTLQTDNEVTLRSLSASDRVRGELDCFREKIVDAATFTSGLENPYTVQNRVTFE